MCKNFAYFPQCLLNSSPRNAAATGKAMILQLAYADISPFASDRSALVILQAGHGKDVI